MGHLIVMIIQLLNPMWLATATTRVWGPIILVLLLTGFRLLASAATCSLVQYEATTTRNQSCKPVCDWSRRYLHQAATPTTDAVCAQLSECLTAVVRPSTVTTDRICFVYPYGVNVSGAVYLGSLTDPIDVKLTSYSTIVGSLLLSAAFPNASFEATDLQLVDGSVTINGMSRLSYFSMPKLQCIASSFGFEGATPSGQLDPIVSIEMDALTFVGGLFAVTNSFGSNTNLTTIRIGSLQHVSGLLQISQNDVLTFLQVASLAFVGGSVSFSQNTALTTLDLDAINFVAQSFTIHNCSSLTLLKLSSLAFVGQYLVIDYNLRLTSVAFSVLTLVGQFFHVNSNSNLTQVSAPAIIRAAISSPGWSVDFCSNSKMFSFSTEIVHAVVGGECALPPCIHVSKCCLLL